MTDAAFSSTDADGDGCPSAVRAVSVFLASGLGEIPVVHRQQKVRLGGGRALLRMKSIDPGAGLW